MPAVMGAPGPLLVLLLVLLLGAGGRVAFAAVASVVDAFVLRGAVTSAASPGFGLPLANVSLDGPSARYCAPQSQLATWPKGSFVVTCTRRPVPAGLNLRVWARQYLDAVVAVNGSASATPVELELEPRPIPGFPARRWRFDGWAIEAGTGDVPGTNVSFLSHPSVYRTPSGRIFMIATAGSTTGQRPGWTQGFWQAAEVSDRGVGVRAVASGGPLITASHPGVEGVSMSARLVFADGRLLMVSGVEVPAQNRMVTILENKNLDDPSHSDEWVGLGTVIVNFTGAPTAAHEDYRLHILEGEQRYVCNGSPRKYWLLVIPDDVPGVTGRACGRMAFAAEALLGPYTFCEWAVPPNGTACHAFPGDLLFGPRENQMYFVESYGSLYRGNTTGPLRFDMLPDKLVVPAPPGSWDDLGQVALTFLPARDQGKRTRLYHASYGTTSGKNPDARKADFGYKLAIGMYSFEWA